MTDQHSAPERSRIEHYSSRSQEALIRLLQAADVARRRVATAIEPHGVTFQQYNVLRILRGAREPLPILESMDAMIDEADELGIGDLTALEVDQLISLLKAVVERPKVQSAKGDRT